MSNVERGLVPFIVGDVEECLRALSVINMEGKSEPVYLSVLYELLRVVGGLLTFIGRG